MRVFASDFQETKNINTEGLLIDLPNSWFHGVRISPVVNRPAVTWITSEQGRLPSGSCPGGSRCRARRRPPVISSVGIFDGDRQIRRVRRNVGGIYTLYLEDVGARKKGPDVLRAVASDVARARGRGSLARLDPPRKP